jgi:hypothetical protein
MPHKCVRCSKLFESGSNELKHGCGCGSKVFLFLQNKDDAAHLGDTKWIEGELANIVKQSDAPVTLDVENVRVLNKGVFELDISSLMKNPVVIKDDEGIYYIRLGARSLAGVVSRNPGKKHTGGS